LQLIRKIEQTGHIPHVEALYQLGDGLGVDIHTMLDTIFQGQKQENKGKEIRD